MPLKLSDELVRAVTVSQGAPVELVHPGTGERYVLVNSERFRRLLADALDFSEPTDDEKLALLQRWGRLGGWEDPADSVFDDIEPR